jgi:site-specific recombinase XerD
MQHPVDAPISPLRQRLIDDMNMRHFSRETQRNYLRDIGRLATFLGRSPDTATIDDLRRFQIWQQEDGVPVPTMNNIVSALRFFFTHTLDRPDLARRLVRLAHPRKLPVVLSRDEVARLLNATTCLKHQAALSVAYGAGLRVAEVSMLKVADIESERMLLRVERGKGGRYRNAMLSEDLLTLLRQWWIVGRQQGVMHRDGWLFPGQHAIKPISTRQLHRIVVEAAHGSIAPDGKRWVSSRPAFLLPVRVLGELFRRLFLTRLVALYDARRLAFFGSMAHLSERRAFLRHLAPVRKKRWVVYAKAPFAGPEAVLAYLSRYTHRVAISNRRLIAFDASGVTFRYKDCRRDGADRQQVMTLATDEFIRRFLLHVLPCGFHRIRHYGLLAGSSRKASLALARKLLNAAAPSDDDTSVEPDNFRPSCPCCGGRMIVIETFERWRQPRGPPDTSAMNRESAP